MTSPDPTGGPPQRPPPPRGFGCLMPTLGAGAVGVVLLVVVGGFVVRAARVQRDIVRRGATAPGVAALRALGCDPGTAVMESRQSWANGDAGAKTETTAFIACLATEGSAVPSCDDVARTYVGTVVPSGKFVAQVRVVRRFKIECQELYGEDGTALGDLNR